jgi:hypothetical protein
VCSADRNPLVAAQFNFPLAAINCRYIVDADGLLDGFYVSYYDSAIWRNGHSKLSHSRGLLTADEEKQAIARALSYRQAQVLLNFIYFTACLLLQ